MRYACESIMRYPREGFGRTAAQCFSLMPPRRSEQSLALQTLNLEKVEESQKASFLRLDMKLCPLSLGYTLKATFTYSDMFWSRSRSSAQNQKPYFEPEIEIRDQRKTPELG